MKLVDKRNGIELYDLENGYQVAKELCTWIPRGYMLRFYPEYHKRYLPEIYDYIDNKEFRDSGVEFAFRIQTTSFGSLLPDEIQQVVSGYQTALDVIKIVKDEFGKKE